jgi:hypothetical protein
MPGCPKTKKTIFYMRKSVIVLVALVALALTSFNRNESETGNAVAQRITGLDVYVYSEPSKAYEVIDNGKVLVTLTGGCSEVVNQAVKKASKNDGAQGVIIYLESSKWIAIKYKE